MPSQYARTAAAASHAFKIMLIRKIEVILLQQSPFMPGNYNLLTSQRRREKERDKKIIYLRRLGPYPFFSHDGVINISIIPYHHHQQLPPLNPSRENENDLYK